MYHNKKLISKKISADVSISQLDALNFINSFINLIKKTLKRMTLKLVVLVLFSSIRAQEELEETQRQKNRI